LIGNAIKYTPDGGGIHVRALAVEKAVRFEVQDSGYGIPAEMQSNLFKEFYRAKTDATANIPGTGLGLSLVKSVIDAHSGRIGVASEEGKGSTFFFELPVASIK
jgi:signal transduction histidine kinase